MTASAVQWILRIQESIQDYTTAGLHEYTNYKNYIHIWAKKFQDPFLRSILIHFDLFRSVQIYSDPFGSVLISFVLFWSNFILRSILIHSDPFRSIQIRSDPFRSLRISFVLFWSNFICFNPLWSTLIRFDLIWSIMIHFDLFWSMWSILIPSDQFWSLLIPSGPVWSILVHSGPFWSILVHFGPFFKVWFQKCIQLPKCIQQKTYIKDCLRKLAVKNVRVFLSFLSLVELYWSARNIWQKKAIMVVHITL